MNTRLLPDRLDGFGRGLLAVTGFCVGAFWLLLGVLPVIDWKGPSLALTEIDWLPALGGIVLIVWTVLGVERPTPLRFIPPAVVAVSAALIGVFQIVRDYVGRILQP